MDRDEDFFDDACGEDEVLKDRIGRRDDSVFSCSWMIETTTGYYGILWLQENINNYKYKLNKGHQYLKKCKGYGT